MPLPLANLDAIVFDVDGTLYHQGPVRRAMLARLGAECLRRPSSGVRTVRALRAYRRAQEELRGHADGAAAQLRLAGERSGLPHDLVAAAVARWMDEEPLALLRAATPPGLAAFLAAAAAKGLRMGVLSDYPARAKLDALGVAHYFDVVVCAQDPGVGAFKPDPRGLRVALERLGVPAARALYVGDRPEVDGVTAVRAGVPAVIVGRGRAPPRHRAAPTDGVHTVRDYATLHHALFGPT